jgi:hypothetical protein
VRTDVPVVEGRERGRCRGDHKRQRNPNEVGFLMLPQQTSQLPRTLIAFRE